MVIPSPERLNSAAASSNSGVGSTAVVSGLLVGLGEGETCAKICKIQKEIDWDQVICWRK